MIYNQQIKNRINMHKDSYQSNSDAKTEYYKLNVKRKSIKSVYSTPCGKAMLKRMLIDSGFFSATEEDTSRNFCIHMLESMGILDEGNIARIVDFMIDGTEIIPEPSDLGLNIETGDENAE